MKVKRRTSRTARLRDRLKASRFASAIRTRQRALPAIIVAVVLWASAVIAVAEYWRSEVPVVQAVGARATAHRVLDLK